jgi:hypothetical protein
LSESLKYDLLLFPRYSDSGIANSKMQGHAIRGSRSLLNMDFYFALFCELDPIPHQVIQDLTQA